MKIKRIGKKYSTLSENNNTELSKSQPLNLHNSLL